MHPPGASAPDRRPARSRGSPAPALGGLTLLLCLLSPSLAPAQDLRLLEGMFRQINSFTIAAHMGDLTGPSELGTNCGAFGLCGMGTEVFINLHATDDLLLELALGTSYMQGFISDREALDFRGAVRSVPTLAIYTSYLRALGQDRLLPFVGASFGLTELWNAQVYDPEGTRYGLRGSTYSQGIAGGVALELGPTAGLFLQGGYDRRRFFSVEWVFPSGTQAVPEGWPRELNLSGWHLSAGLQFNLRND